MAILPRSGRVAIAIAIKEQPLHLAWGSGDPAWGETFPPENADATGLIDEVGRRIVTSASYVIPDAAGEIEITGAGKFSVTTTPTNMLLISTRFDFADAPAVVVREFGLFVGTEVVSGLPLGQMYFTPDQIADPGHLLQLENCKPIFRNASTRELREILIIF